jgi:asparagine synthase (glutamine-hydrolysing)
MIRSKLTGAVRKRLMADRPLGLFISGGLDSSLIAAITRKLLPHKKIQSFSIGMPGSPDLANAKIVADYLGTEHHPFYFTPEQGIAAVRDVIRQLETYDITTIRASTPQYLLSQYVRQNTDVKVVLSGEGSDELFGGYLYFHRTPSNTEFVDETNRLVRELECYDVLRTDRTTAGNGLEVRVPFLDRGFMKYVLALPGSLRNPNVSNGMEYGATMEKKILRDAFSVASAGSEYLPNNILYRTKDAFSDACGYDWIPSLRAHCESLVSEEEYDRRAEIYPHLTPTTKEAFYYRRVFEEFYPNQQHTLNHYWLPNWVPNGGVAEPSAKILKLL